MKFILFSLLMISQMALAQEQVCKGSFCGQPVETPEGTLFLEPLYVYKGEASHMAPQKKIAKMFCYDFKLQYVKGSIEKTTVRGMVAEFAMGEIMYSSGFGPMNAGMKSVICKKPE